MVSLRFGLIALYGCGGIAVIGPDASSDGGVDIDVTDAPVETPDLGLPPCKTNLDCFGWETCQSGWCCTGMLANGQCKCGDSPRCDLTADCCYFHDQQADALACNHNGCGVDGHH